MHGASGLTEEEFREVINRGIRKINYYTSTSKIAAEAVSKKSYTQYHDMVVDATNAIKEDVKKDLKDQLLREIDRSLIAELPDDKLEELNRMAAANGQIDPNEIAKRIEESNLDVTDIVGTTMARFREIYLEDQKSDTEQEPNKEAEE